MGGKMKIEYHEDKEGRNRFHIKDFVRDYFHFSFLSISSFVYIQVVRLESLYNESYRNQCTLFFFYQRYEIHEIIISFDIVNEAILERQKGRKVG